MADARAVRTAADAADAASSAEALASRLGHRFGDTSLLREALVHRSVSGTPAERPARRGGRRGIGSNERLEFVGDRVLGLLVAEWLLERFPDEQEGELGRRHAHLVSRDVLAPIASALALERALALAPDALRAGVGGLANVLADALEALLGAVYLDAGIEAARHVVRLHWEDAVAGAVTPPVDAKSALQEWLMARSLGLPDYVELSREGPSHAPQFVIEVRTDAGTGRGEASSKRVAERLAATDLLARLEAAGRARRAVRKGRPGALPLDPGKG